MTDKNWARNYAILWQGQFVSILGTHAYMIAVMFWIKQNTGSATLLGLIMMIANFPALIMGVFGGAIADRFNRKKIIIAMDMVNGISVLSLAAVMFYIPDQHSFILVYITLITMILAISGSIFKPAILAAIPDMVPKDKLDTANAASQAGQQFAQMIGSGAGGILFRILGAPVLLLIDGCTYLFSAFSESFVEMPQEKKAETEIKKTFSQLFKTFLSDTKEGFHYLVNKHGMKEFFILGGTINFLVIPCTILLPFYIEDYLNLKTDWYGFIITAFTIGTMLGFIFAGVIVLQKRKKKIAIFISLLGTALFICSMGLTKNAYVVLFIMVGIGALNGYLGVLILGIIQTNTESSMRGRIFGLLGTLTGGLTPLGMGLSGIIFDLLDHSIPTIYIGTGMILLVISMIIYFNKDFHKILDN
ncbi:MAG: MFS transporter [Methylococcales bacterium]|jgi:MFS transporter, DHA3 family, macrolide efflux protein|nr:MFS transporter [Methylococcales bacterium]MBT7409660.1 MFS transporter [Methylococcales bacterium]